MTQKKPTLQQKIVASEQLQQAQREGLDLNLLWDNLQRSVSQRIHRHQIALDTLRQLQQARRS